MLSTLPLYSTNSLFRFILCQILIVDVVQGIYTEDMPVALRELNDNYPEAMIVQQQQNQLLGHFPPSFLKIKKAMEMSDNYPRFHL